MKMYLFQIVQSNIHGRVLSSQKNISIMIIKHKN